MSSSMVHQTYISDLLCFSSGQVPNMLASMVTHSCNHNSAVSNSAGLLSAISEVGIATMTSQPTQAAKANPTSREKRR